MKESPTELDFVALAEAVEFYENRARTLFTREDRYRARGEFPNAQTCHYWGLAMWNAARSEILNRRPRGLRS